MNSFANHFLIAEPDLLDSNFYQTVVLLLEHSENGAFGFIVNRRTNTLLEEAVPEFKGTKAGQLPLYIGGPVEKRNLFFLMEADNTDTGYKWSPLTKMYGEYLTKVWPSLPKHLQPQVRIFAGYSGWGPGQLENEMRFNSWKTLPYRHEHVFYHSPSRLWSMLIRTFGGVYEIAAITGFKPCLN